MKKRMFTIMLLLVIFFAQGLYAQEEGKNPEGSLRGGKAPAVSCKFEPDDVIATEDNHEYYVGKVLSVSGTGQDTEMNILFADGNELWIKSANVIKKFRLINKKDIKVGQQVLYTTTKPENFQNESIRYAMFVKGKITSKSKLNRNLIMVNADEVRWDQQVIIW